MNLRRPLNWFAAIGFLGSPIGGWVFGGPETSTGNLIIGTGSLLLIGAWAVELGLRFRERRQQRSASRQA